MSLQNRVTPFGEIIAVPDRGLFTGNRGIIHDSASRTLLQKRWTSRRWLVCQCDFKGRRRALMSAGSWTELFFLDEATALAAGHRPCFECRRPEAEAFRQAFSDGERSASVDEIDRLLHRERLDGRAKRLHPVDGAWSALPDGAMIAGCTEAFVVVGGRALRWSPGGYSIGQPAGTALLLTPPSTVRALSRGYRPVLHPSVSDKLLS
jgi:hypothetical protein